MKQTDIIEKLKTAKQLVEEANRDLEHQEYTCSTMCYYQALFELKDIIDGLKSDVTPLGKFERMARLNHIVASREFDLERAELIGNPIMICEAREKLKQEISAREDLREECEQMLDTIDDHHAQVMRKRYFENKDTRQIAEEMFFSQRHIQRSIKEALEKF